MKTIITYGTYDLFHIGHVRLLQRARQLGDRLVVGVSSDEFNTLKGKRSIMPYQDRAEIVSALSCVDEIFPEHNWEQKAQDIVRHQASVLVMGDDWTGKFDHFKNLCEVVYLPRTAGISSSEVKATLSALKDNKIQELHEALSVLQNIAKQLSN